MPWRKPGAALSTIPFPVVDPRDTSAHRSRSWTLSPGPSSFTESFSPSHPLPSFSPSTPFRTFFFFEGPYNLSFLMRVSLRISTKFSARRLSGRDDDLSSAAIRERKKNVPRGKSRMGTIMSRASSRFNRS